MLNSNGINYPESFLKMAERDSLLTLKQRDLHFGEMDHPVDVWVRNTHRSLKYEVLQAYGFQYRVMDDIYIFAAARNQWEYFLKLKMFKHPVQPNLIEEIAKSVVINQGVMKR